MVYGRAGEYPDHNLLASRLHLILVGGFFRFFALTESKDRFGNLSDYSFSPGLICYSFDLITEESV